MLLKLFTDYHHSDALRRRFHENPNAVCDEYCIPASERKILRDQDRVKLENALAAEITYLFDKGSADGNDAMYPPPKQHPQYPPPKRKASAQYPPPKKKGADPQYPPPKKSHPQYPPPKKAGAQYPPPETKAKKKAAKKRR